MIDFVALPLAGVLVISIVGSLAAGRLEPVVGARIHAVLLASVVTATVPTLWLIGLSGIAHTDLHNPVVDWSYHLLPDHTPAGAIIGGVSLGLAITGTVRAVRVVLLHRRLRCVDTPPMQTVESDDAFAYTIPGPAGTIAVSTGLRRALDDDEYAVVIEHERAHARHRHDRYKLLGLLAVAFVPPTHVIARRLDFALERWADEAALRRTGNDRRLAAHTIAKVAMATTVPAGVLGFDGRGPAARASALLEPAAPSVTSRLQASALTIVTLALALYQLHHSAVFAHHLLP
ncbi:MAG: M56 family metallopeptidase [Ilumatobacter sp.]|uniref:M56 family metallopeptidase n=1 Tax=Ilumatobacter sp. TaxID=1967498 RepID=UPI002615802E|nr:M56 family metallopeptidase [Ilumatobacter sp.]MDJ0768139.1 M56 family metallopeptidase [Ilumatobacter sp.]